MGFKNRLVCPLVVAIAIELWLIWLSFGASTFQEQMGLILFSTSFFPLVLLILFILYPSEFKELIASLPLPSLPPKPSVQSSTPSAEPTSQSKAATPRPGSVPPGAPTKKLPDLASQIRRKPEIIKLVSGSPEKDASLPTTRSLPTIVPKGLIKPPATTGPEKFTTIVPKQILEKPPATPKHRRLDAPPERPIDLQTLISKAKGMKYDLAGWWPLGWTRVIPRPDLPAQFWRMKRGKPTHGLLMGQDRETGEYVAWVATVRDGVFRGIFEALRAKSQKELVERAKGLMKRIDMEQAALAEDQF